MISWKSTPDEPWGNPFAQGTSQHQSWAELNLWTKEHLAVFQAEMLESMPPEEASAKEWLDYSLKAAAGTFDVFARAFSSEAMLSDQAAEIYEEYLIEIGKAVEADAHASRIPCISERLFSSELRRRLHQRKQYWTGHILRTVRERKETSSANVAANAGGGAIRETPDGLPANVCAVAEPVLAKRMGDPAVKDGEERQLRGIIGTEKAGHSKKVPRRTPDLKMSRERLAFLETVATELATIKHDLAGYCTAKLLKKKHPGFVAFKYISNLELQEIVDGEPFSPRAFAESLTLRKFGNHELGDD